MANHKHQCINVTRPGVLIAKTARLVYFMLQHKSLCTVQFRVDKIGSIAAGQHKFRKETTHRKKHNIFQIERAGHQDHDTELPLDNMLR